MPMLAAVFAVTACARQRSGQLGIIRVFLLIVSMLKQVRNITLATCPILVVRVKAFINHPVS